MRIAFVAPLVSAIREPQLGGSQAIVADLAAALTRRGHDVDVFAATGSRIDGVRVVDTGVNPESLLSSLFRADGPPPATEASRDAFAKTYDLVRAGGYDLVHNHAFDVPAIDLGGGLPMVHTLHLGPQADIAAALDRTEATVVCVSESQRDLWERMTRVDAVIRNGVAVDRIGWSRDGGAGALYAGRFSPEKGTAEAIDIALAAGVPIVVVGHAYDASYAELLRARFRERKEVEFRESMPRPDVWRLMAQSCALLCPIKWDEPFGLAAAEAQAAGTPVIGFRRGALGEVVEDGVTGALVNDISSAAEALHRRFDRAACRRHAEVHLTLDAMVDAHEKLYSS
jgi:UDP-glucose:tetrahydrobiopterin glucosyltransferase